MSKKIFIDLGAYCGDSLETALRHYPGFDFFYAFEPFEESFAALRSKFGSEPRIILSPKAAALEDGRAKLYLHRDIASLPKRSQGNSMMASKVNIDPDNFRWVETVDFSKFLKDNFSREDRIVLKVDIEGLEYDLLEKMLAEGTVSYVERLFCEWHKEKAGIPEDRHCRLIESLQKAGLSVTGENETDEFKKVMSGVKFNPSAFL